MKTFKIKLAADGETKSFLFRGEDQNDALENMKCFFYNFISADVEDGEASVQIKGNKVIVEVQGKVQPEGEILDIVEI